MKSDVVIVGAGIAGLSLGLELLKKHFRVTILEKENRIGGRIWSKKFQKFSYESGAGRFSNLHTKLLTLLKKYDLDNKLYPLDVANKQVDNHTKFTSNINEYYKILIEFRSKFSISELTHMTTYDYICKVLGKELADYFVMLYGYRGEIYYANAYCGLNMLELDYNTKTYFILGGGLNQLVDAMKNDFVLKGGTLLTNIMVNNIYNSYDSNFLLETNKKEVFSCNKLVLAIPSKDILKLRPKNPIILEAISGIVPIPLLRIYFLYDTPNPLLKNIKKTISDLDINYIIPINNQIIMISYSDTAIAKRWYILYRTNKKKFMKKLKQEFELVTGVELVYPSKISIEYWKEGVHVWGKNINYIENYGKIINPIGNLYLCNEAFSKNQGWIEGSLEIATDILKLF